MPGKKRKLIANDNIAQFQRQFLAEYDETLCNVLAGLLAKEEGHEHRDLRKCKLGVQQPEVKIKVANKSARNGGFSIAVGPAPRGRQPR
jgi:hypothetical protein